MEGVSETIIILLYFIKIVNFPYTQIIHYNKNGRINARFLSKNKFYFMQ